MTARHAKIMMAASLSVFAFLAAFNNLTNPAFNFPYVQHVMSMDTLPLDSDVLYRAIRTPSFWWMGYAAIILVELSIAALLAIGACLMFVRRAAPAARFDAAKRWVIAGAAMGFFLWFFGFMTIGSQWFLMFQSKIWNTQNSAFQFTMVMLGVLIFVNQPEPVETTAVDVGDRG